MLFAGLLVSIIWYPGTVVSDNVQMYENSIDFGNTESRSDVISFFYVCIMHFLFALTSNDGFCVFETGGGVTEIIATGLIRYEEFLIPLFRILLCFYVIFVS